jgi:hypothetical protein
MSATMNAATQQRSSSTACTLFIDEEVSESAFDGRISEIHEKSNTGGYREDGELVHEPARIFAAHGCDQCSGIDRFLQSKQFSDGDSNGCD